MRNWQSTLISASLAACIVSCGPSWEEVRAAAYQEVERFRPEADEMLAKLAVIGDDAAAVPWDDARRLDVGADGPTDTAGMEVPYGTDTVLVSLEHLQTSDAELEAEADPLSFAFLSLTRLRWVLEGDFWDIDPESIERNAELLRQPLRRFQDARWLIVLRTRSLVLPEVKSLNAAAFGAGDGTETSAGTFEKGRFVGDAVVYDLSDATLVGVVPLDVASSDKVEIRGNLTWMESDLRSNILAALREELDAAAGAADVR